MKRKYVPTTLNEYLNENKSITLKRGYGDRKPVVVGSKAPLRNQVLAFVSESNGVTRSELKKFIAGLNETSKNPVAAATMWLNRNSKFFITENKNGQTTYKLSSLGRKLVKHLSPVSISEQETIRKRINEMSPSKKTIFEDFEEDEFEENNRPGSYDFVDRKKGYERPGIYDTDESLEECSEGDEGKDEEDEKMDEAAKARIKKIVERIKAKNGKKLNEEMMTEDEDELTFDDIEMDDEDEKEDEIEGDEDEIKGDTDELESDEDEIEGDIDDEFEDEEEGEEKVEITEFVITVDDVDDAIGELAELGVDAEQVTDEEGEVIENQIKVSADDWESLKGWLEEKGVDIEEMFGGEIEVEDEDELEGDVEELESDEDELEGDIEELVSDEDELESDTEELEPAEDEEEFSLDFNEED